MWEYIGWGGFFIGCGIGFGLAAISNSFDDISTSIDNFNEQFERWVDMQERPEPAEHELDTDGEDDQPGFDPFPHAEYPDPTQEEINSPRFEAVWQAIKGWDISRYGDGVYSGPTGNDVMHILRALDKRLGEEGLKSWANPS